MGLAGGITKQNGFILLPILLFVGEEKPIESFN